MRLQARLRGISGPHAAAPHTQRRSQQLMVASWGSMRSSRSTAASATASPSSPAPPPPPSPPSTTSMDRMTQEYNATMAKQMQWGDPYEYHPQRGLYWNEIAPGLICGTQPRSGHDVRALASEGVSHILNLQTDKDMQHWGVDIRELEHHCKVLGMTLSRRSARDFDPHSLRKTLPSAVAVVRRALVQGDRVYVHCTAGLGRAPAVCIAYMFWFLDMDLDAAYKALTDIRPCGPKRDAIRGATFDLLSGAPADSFERLGRDAWASLAEEDRYALQWRVLKA